MTSIIARQPKGITVGGQFAATEHSESFVTLGPLDGGHLSEESILDAVSRHEGPGAVPGVRRRIAETTTEGGRELFLQRCDALYNPDSEYVIDRSVYGPTPEHCDALAALGYTSVNQFSRDRTKNFRGVGSLIDSGIGPERLEVLGKLSAHESQWSAWEKAAYLNSPLEDLDGVVENKDLSRVGQYLATVDLLGDEAKSARARKALEMKIGDRALIEADEYPLEDLADLRDALPESKRYPANILRLALRGIDGPRLRTYGTKACETYTGRQLDEALVAPKTIRSFLAAGFDPRLDDMKVLRDAGYTSGNDLKAASKVLRTTDVKVLAEARKHATGAQMATFAANTRDQLRFDDPQAIGRLTKLGIDSPDQLRPWAASIHARANTFIDRDQSVLAIYADIIKAGVTPERLGALTRAGIPVTEAAKHKDTKDPWAAGQKYRAAWDADQASKAARHWVNEPAQWAFTEENYLDGVTE
ncbi:hypothetical protein Achl_4074 (plasmid) [Pseudarthrobacter chlorophenolicus A6]|uniref:Uncharacterized protein n=1 Tax=Pseudarthrobacter chlorophenolicus (strain ATCC 700700 / DSM 12829 / CIP 107037 / JCM 12360 / KCTC 9906 / NCIMB 13794 / A6) TaxID=452863 RepID=B8HHX8_PSECP|nr:hypothetical protein [Pseudarthrobacter chlorophenolicus]ACL42025.1 hypothetical protein Achl_4074 [Pseudarthrobacter chlorophenolicus A6]SDQ20491.1 hypothetical protein SAMN04489738_0725 [Pseudarthrobacter chlorophenolicus]